MSNLTKKAIIESFFQMATDNPNGKITVTELVERCGINRNTFYYHFPDLPALVDEIMKTEMQNILQNKKAIASPEEAVWIALDFARKNKMAAMHIYNTINREVFEQYLSRIAEYSVSSYIDTVSQDDPICDSDKNAIVLFFKSACVGLILDWLNKNEGAEAEEDILKRLLYLFEGATALAIERSRQKK